MTRHFKHDPAWQYIPLLVKEIHLPTYTQETNSPWMHLLDSRWKLLVPALWIRGPFPGHRTLRSIHFALPRTLPHSFSRGITYVFLCEVRFRRIEDTICLVSELPDLHTLVLNIVTWESLPTELPRRRPRANRNHLSKIELSTADPKQVDKERVEPSSLAFVALALFLGVYSPSSTFLLPLDVLAAIQAAFQLIRKFRGHSRMEFVLNRQGLVKHISQSLPTACASVNVIPAILTYHRHP